MEPQCYSHGIDLIVFDQTVTKRALVWNSQCFLPPCLHWRTITHALPVTGPHAWLFTGDKFDAVCFGHIAKKHLNGTIWGRKTTTWQKWLNLREASWCQAVERCQCGAEMWKKQKSFQHLTPSTGLKTNQTRAELWQTAENEYPHWTYVLGQV